MIFTLRYLPENITATPWSQHIHLLVDDYITVTDISEDRQKIVHCRGCGYKWTIKINSIFEPQKVLYEGYNFK